jgi:hypothetical protein
MPRLSFRVQGENSPAGGRGGRALGSALFVLETIDPLASHPDAISRVVQEVVTTVGFLGAGSRAAWPTGRFPLN